MKKIFIIIESGLVSEIIASDPTEVTIIDNDIGRLSDPELTIWTNNHGTQFTSSFSEETANVSPKFIERVSAEHDRSSNFIIAVRLFEKNSSKLKILGR